MSWPVARIGDVCEVVSGATPKTGTPAFWGGDIPWVTPKDLSDLECKVLHDTPRKITKLGLKSCSATMLPANSVLLSSRAPIGLVAVNAIPVATNQGFKSLVPNKERIWTHYLYWWLKVNKADLERRGRGATFKEVSKKIVEEIEIPLPPLAEQKRIAGILDAADALRAKRRESIAQLDALLQSTFLEMFGDPVTNPKGWKMIPLGEVATLQRGFDLPVQVRNAGTVPVFAANGPVGTHDYPKVSGPGVVTGRSGTLGKVHYVEDSYWPLNTALWVKNFHGNNPRWIAHLLSLMHLEQYTRGAGVPTLNRNLVHVVNVPRPPLKYQLQFANFATILQSHEMKKKEHLGLLDGLFSSLQHRAFNGEL